MKSIAIQVVSLMNGQLVHSQNDTPPNAGPSKCYAKCIEADIYKTVNLNMEIMNTHCIKF
jgi:hypothetical protein